MSAPISSTGSPDHMFDPAAVRTQFPALDTEWALFDNAGGTAPCLPVIERASAHLSRRPVQLGATYPCSVEAAREVQAGREAMAQLTGVEADRVFIGPSSSVMIRRIAEGLRRELEPGDEVIVTALDHHANVGPWEELERQGAVIKTWPFCKETHELRLEDLQPLLSERTKLVAFGHVSNLIGTIHDVRAACELIRSAGAISVVDGVAAAPHRRPEVDALGADFYVFSAYKVFGPHQGVLVGRPELLERLAPVYHPFLDDRKKGWEPAGGTYELMASLPGMVEHITSLGSGAGRASTADIDSGYDAITRYEADLARPLLEFLAGHPGVTLYGLADSADPSRVPTVSFSVGGRLSSEIATAAEEHKVAVRWGHFYAWNAAKELGLLEQDGVVRASMVHYNTAEEVSRLVEALESVIGAG